MFFSKKEKVRVCKYLLSYSVYHVQTKQQINSMITIDTTDPITNFEYIKAIQQYKKPYLDIDLYELSLGNYLIFDIHEWFDQNNIKILNIAGNAGETKKQSSEIFNLVKKYLTIWIRKYNNE